MTGRCFLATFRPLIQTPGGRHAAARFGLPGFIDGSCRREPDFESPFPSISATCRAGNFAPRLGVGDRVAYLTVKGKYQQDSKAGWRFVAVLRVLERLSSHDEAASWYRHNGLALPSNCIVEGNEPKALEFTNGNPPAAVRDRVSATTDPVGAIKLWDSIYRRRVRKWPVFLVCEAELLELSAPVRVEKSDILAIFSTIPGTLTPPEISCAQVDSLLRIAPTRAA